MVELEKIKEREEITSQLFRFSSVSVLLNTPDQSAVKVCEEYFDGYTYPNRTDEPLSTWDIQDTYSSGQEFSFRVDTEHRKMTLLRSEDDIKQPMRLIRDLVMLTDVQRGVLILKGGSVVNNNGRGVVIIGEEGAGKTTLILKYMLEAGKNSHFVSNSHVGLKVEDDGLVAYGYPMSMGVRLGALEVMKNGGYENLGQLISHLKNNKQPEEDDRHYLDPEKLRKYLGCRCVGITQISSMIIVDGALQGSDTEVSQLTPQSVEDHLNNFFLRHSNWSASGLRQDLGVDMDASTKSIGNIVRGCDVYKLTHNITQGGIKELLDNL